MTNKEEEWKAVPNYEDYFVSNYGRVRSVKQGKTTLLKPYNTGNGYLCVRLYKNGQKRNAKVHQLVLLVFQGEAPDRMVVRHLDGDRRNNHLSNLVYGTSKENAADRTKHGTHRKFGAGENNPASKLTNADVFLVRVLRNEFGWTQSQIASIMDCSMSVVHSISKRITWKHI